ncbi:DNA-directed RNA polymerase subunit alpha [Clostridium botulinum B str. Osaka05]|uniref:DNA-directed RNA polymerase subunit alpha n=1 Tax=Clostridium botulinum B str. Osaka05 TaxID=1407017 RepID=A0A060N3E0_CLOBO|nr:DNA-directed RNA polymerase subunit alpha C-terminal domain-containing protein [Clostridium botulinum]BAO05016.1 DNA-directed RNA polymerase subunit alpha [Clostridium botulinum B str. Osaka05]
MDSLKFYHEDLKKIFGENTKYVELNDIRFLDKKAQIKVVSQIEGDLEEFNTITLESYLEMLDKYYNADKLKYKNEVSIKTLNFSTMIRNALSRAGISYVRQLENLTEKQLKKVENIGEKAMSDIKMELKRIGKKLKEESYYPHIKEIEQIGITVKDNVNKKQ